MIQQLSGKAGAAAEAAAPVMRRQSRRNFRPAPEGAGRASPQKPKVFAAMLMPALRAGGEAAQRGAPAEAGGASYRNMHLYPDEIIPIKQIPGVSYDEIFNLS